MGYNNDSSLGSIFAAFLFGGIVGAAVAALVTPRSGPENRERLRESMENFREHASKTAYDVRSRANDAWEKGRDVLDEKRSELESAWETGRETMEREKNRLTTCFRKNAPEMSDEA